jgi:2-phospho-L-lactate guanylyltransferase
LLKPDVLRRLIEGAGPSPVCALAPDRAEQGTNLLYQSPIRFTTFSYGEGSFARHCGLAGEAGLRVVVRREAALAFDLDLPDDVREWRRICEAASAKTSGAAADFSSFRDLHE